MTTSAPDPAGLSLLTGSDNWFEDFVPGTRFRHARGRTIGDFDLAPLTLLVMNTAQGHFNEDRMAGTPFGGRIVFGGITASIVVGLATQDTAEHAVAEVGIDGLRFREPVRLGDTVYAATEVLAADPVEGDDAGLVRFHHWGFNQRGAVVCELDREVLVRRRPEGAR